MKCPCRLPTLILHRPRLSFFSWTVAIATAVVSLCPPLISSADTCAPAQWERYRTPSHKDLLLLPGSDIDRFAVGGAEGTTFYAIGTWNSPCANATPDDPFSPDAMLFNSGQAPRLWKSTDSGATWEDRTPQVLAAVNLADAGTGDYDDFLVFTAVAAAPDDEAIVVVAGYDRYGRAVIVGSHDGASEFSWMGCNSVDGRILSAAISPATDGIRSIAVGTTDGVTGGKIWRQEAGRFWATSWTDTSAYSGWADTPLWANDPSSILAVTSLEFSPNYPRDRAVLAAIIARAEEPDGDSYEGFHLVAGTWNTTGAWNTAAGFDRYPVLIQDGRNVIHASSATTTFLMRGLTDLALPADYDGDTPDRRTALIAVNGALVNPSSESIITEGGFLFWVQGGAVASEMLLREENPWVASVAYHGTTNMRGRMLVGTAYPSAWTWSDIRNWFDSGSPALSCCSGVGVLSSEDNDPCCPRWTRAERPPSGQFNAQVAWSADGELAFASTSGAGRLWHDGRSYADESAFSRSPAPHVHWEQTGLVDTMIHHLKDIAYSPSGNTLHLHTSHSAANGRVCDCESIWRTGNEGETWVRELHGRPGASHADEDSFDDIIDAYHRGFFKPWTKGFLQSAGVRYLVGDAINVDDEQQVLEGFEADAVYRLVEGEGRDWEMISEFVLNYEGLLLMNCPGAPGSVLYAGFDNLWWDFTVNEPLPYKPDGSDPDLPSGHDCRKTSGAARVLDPGRRDCCGDQAWDYLIRGLRGTADTGGIYEQLVLAGAHCAADAVRLWAIDNGNRYWSEDGGDSSGYDWCTGEFANDQWGRLWVYDDCYALAHVSTIMPQQPLTIPPDLCICSHEDFILEWERPCDACEYEMQIALDRQFRHIVLDTDAFMWGVAAETSTRFYRPPEPLHPSILIPKGTLDPNQTYWWRVRAHLAETGEIISSWWSEPEPFHTAPGPPGLLELRAPGDGASAVPVNGVGFTWTRVSGATRYDFMLVDRNRAHVASQVSDLTSFILPLTLEYDSPYIWRVIALDGDRPIAESARASFRTEPEPAPSEYVSTTPSIVPPPSPVRQDWPWYFAGIVALLLLLALGALSHVNRKLKRSRADRRPASRREPWN